MKNRIPISIFIFLVLSFFAYAEDQIQIIEVPAITKEFHSPNAEALIIYSGLLQGDGSFYHGKINDNNLILSSYFRYGPMVNWLSNKKCEFRIPTGSPNYHSYFYDYEHKILSKDYNLVKGVDIKRNIVVCAPDYELEFYDIFSGKLIYSYKIEALERNNKLGWTHVLESNFNDKGEYILKYFIEFNQMKSKTIKLDF